MPKAPLSSVIRACDRVLKSSEFHDWESAYNGLQVENRGHVTRLAAAVDASLATVRLAVEARADLLLVHHGLFWDARHPWTGRQYELLRLLLDHDLAVYSAHLPLDAHPRVGNNAQLCDALGLKRRIPFFICKGRPVGFAASARLPLAELAGRLRSAVGGHVHVIPGGPPVCRHIGVVSGGGGTDLRQAAAEGMDTFITGEGPHWTYGTAEEVGINVLYAGHYATETFGVKALAAHLSRQFGLPWSFVDHPTGL